MDIAYLFNEDEKNTKALTLWGVSLSSFNHEVNWWTVGLYKVVRSIPSFITFIPVTNQFLHLVQSVLWPVIYKSKKLLVGSVYVVRHPFQ